MIEVRKNITISRHLNNHNSFSANIRLDFIPDEVIIKSIVFANDPTDPNNINVSIYSDLVDDFIGTFSYLPSGNLVTPNIVFTLKKQVNRLYTFDLYQTTHNFDDNDMILCNVNADLVIHLEFVKYRV